MEFWLQSGGPGTVAPFRRATPLAYLLPEFDLRMPFGPTEFTQVNAGVNRILVRRAVDMLDPRPAIDAQCRCPFVEAGNRDRIAEHIVQPAQLGRRGIDLQPALDQPLIMAFARPYHQPMLAKSDRLMETVGRHMVDG